MVVSQIMIAFIDNAFASVLSRDNSLSIEFHGGMTIDAIERRMMADLKFKHIGAELRASDVLVMSHDGLRIVLPENFSIHVVQVLPELVTSVDLVRRYDMFYGSMLMYTVDPSDPDLYESWKREKIRIPIDIPLTFREWVSAFPSELWENDDVQFAIKRPRVIDRNAQHREEIALKEERVDAIVERLIMCAGLIGDLRQQCNEERDIVNGEHVFGLVGEFLEFLNSYNGFGVHNADVSLSKMLERNIMRARENFKDEGATEAEAAAAYDPIIGDVRNMVFGGVLANHLWTMNGTVSDFIMYKNTMMHIIETIVEYEEELIENPHPINFIVMLDEARTWRSASVRFMLLVSERLEEVRVVIEKAEEKLVDLTKRLQWVEKERDELVTERRDLADAIDLIRAVPDVAEVQDDVVNKKTMWRDRLYNTACLYYRSTMDAGIDWGGPPLLVERIKELTGGFALGAEIEPKPVDIFSYDFAHFLTLDEWKQVFTVADEYLDRLSTRMHTNIDNMFSINQLVPVRALVNNVLDDLKSIRDAENLGELYDGIASRYMWMVTTNVFESILPYFDTDQAARIKEAGNGGPPLTYSELSMFVQKLVEQYKPVRI